MNSSENNSKEISFAKKCVWNLKNCIIGFFINFFPKNFPKRKLFPLLMVLAIEGISLTNINSYVGYLLVDMGTVQSVDKAGYYSGWLMAAFPLAQFLSSFIIGALSDNIGKRPIILFATLGVGITNLLFGFSFNYYFIFAMRFLNGILNGNIGVVKTYMGELTDDSNRVQTFNFIGLMWCIGSMIGSMVGGLLYDPVDKYPNLFGSITLFEKYPGLLPQIVDSFFSFIALVLAYFYLLENNVVERKNYLNSFWGVIESLKNTFIGMFKYFNKKNIWSIYCSLEFFLLGFGNTTFFTLFPLVMIAKVTSGGFGLNTNDVGYFCIISSISGLITTIFLYKPVVKKIGLRLTYSLTIFLTAIFFGIYPSLELFNSFENPIFWIFIGIFAFCYSLISQFTFSSLNTLIVNSAEIETMGISNGIAQSFISLSKIVGPIGLSPLLSWGFSNDLNYPLNQHLPFYILLTSGIISSIMMLFTPKSLNYPKNYINESDTSYSELKTEKTEGDVEIQIIETTENKSQQ